MESKRIIVIAKYEAYVDDDVTAQMVLEKFKEEIEDKFFYGYVIVETPLNDSKKTFPSPEVHFELNDVQAGTECIIAISGE